MWNAVECMLVERRSSRSRIVVLTTANYRPILDTSVGVPELIPVA